MNGLAKVFLFVVLRKRGNKQILRNKKSPGKYHGRSHKEQLIITTDQTHGETKNRSIKGTNAVLLVAAGRLQKYQVEFKC